MIHFGFVDSIMSDNARSFTSSLTKDNLATDNAINNGPTWTAKCPDGYRN